MRNKFFLTLAALAIGAVSQADIVLNHVSTNENDSANVGNTLATQDFEASFDAFDCIVIEDFTVNANQTLITQVQAVMAGFNGFNTPGGWSSVTGFRVELFTSTGSAVSSLTGNAGSQLVAAGSASIVNLGWNNAANTHNNNGTASLVTLPVNIVLPGAGTYYVGVIGVLNAGQSLMQIGVRNNTVVSGGNNAFQANPGGGFSIPGNGQFLTENAMYRVDATAVPEPGSMIALGLGAAALAARRRRKAA